MCTVVTTTQLPPILVQNYQTLETFKPADLQTKLKLLLSLSECLSALHAVGIVHADLKPEHIIIDGNPYAPRVRLIDFDSSFAELAPPESGCELAIDPVYMSPEAYRLITGNNVRLNRKADSFAFAILIHQVLAGSLPGFDREKYTYPYAAVSETVECLMFPLRFTLCSKRWFVKCIKKDRYFGLAIKR